MNIFRKAFNWITRRKAQPQPKVKVKVYDGFVDIPSIRTVTGRPPIRDEGGFIGPYWAANALSGSGSEPFHSRDYDPPSRSSASESSCGSSSSSSSSSESGCGSCGGGGD